MALPVKIFKRGYTLWESLCLSFLSWSEETVARPFQPCYNHEIILRMEAHSRESRGDS